MARGSPSSRSQMSVTATVDGSSNSRSGAAASARSANRRTAASERSGGTGIDDLAGYAQRLPAGGEQVELRRPASRSWAEVGHLVDHVLAVVEHDQQATVVEGGGQGRAGGRLGRPTQRPADGGEHAGRLGHRRQLDHPRPAVGPARPRRGRPRPPGGTCRPRPGRPTSPAGGLRAVGPPRPARRRGRGSRSTGGPRCPPPDRSFSAPVPGALPGPAPRPRRHRAADPGRRGRGPGPGSPPRAGAAPGPGRGPARRPVGCGPPGRRARHPPGGPSGTGPPSGRPHSRSRSGWAATSCSSSPTQRTWRPSASSASMHSSVAERRSSSSRARSPVAKSSKAKSASAGPCHRANAWRRTSVAWLRRPPLQLGPALGDQGAERAAASTSPGAASRT